MLVLASLQETIKNVKQNFIAPERKLLLDDLVSIIQQKMNKNEAIHLNFICTHNSRRSHLAQIWAQTMAYYFKVKNVFCYSGGTETTALFPMIVETLTKQGLQIEKKDDSINAHYAIKYAEKELPIIAFSKLVNDKINPKNNFVAIMTCTQAEKDCPLVLGAEKRIVISYEDPKIFDGTAQQVQKYEERSLQIATEMYYIFTQLEIKK